MLREVSATDYRSPTTREAFVHGSCRPMADRLDQIPAPAANDLHQLAQPSAVSQSVVVVVVNIWIVRVRMFDNFVHMRV